MTGKIIRLKHLVMNLIITNLAETKLFIKKMIREIFVILL